MIFRLQGEKIILSGEKYKIYEEQKLLLMSWSLPKKYVRSLVPIEFRFEFSKVATLTLIFLVSVVKHYLITRVIVIFGSKNQIVN